MLRLVRIEADVATLLWVEHMQMSAKVAQEAAAWCDVVRRVVRRGAVRARPVYRELVRTKCVGGLRDGGWLHTIPN